jgi:hypothetical protein
MAMRNQLLPCIAAILAAAVIAGAALAQELRQPTAQDAKPAAGQQPKLPELDAKAMADDKAALAAADLIDAAYAGQRQPEAVRMLLSILRGPSIGATDGWFGPAETRYTWAWLAALHGVDPEKGFITRSMFRGPESLFARLDRDKDGRITADDLDWSERSAFVQQTALVKSWFRKMDADGDGQVTKEELARFFDKAAKGKSSLSFDEFHEALLEARGAAKGGSPVRPASMRPVLLRGLFNGEIGSINEGPHVGQPAPNFKLRTLGGKETVELAKVLGKKPVVLVFGNYTCSPFCASYPGVEPIHERFKEDAIFLMVYVREAHPADGWSMGVDIKQPRTIEERVGVAERFYKQVRPSIPVLVDELNDPVGHAYSGMPSRLYVIDAKGTVVFKNGRGPFGFKTGELEQALVMALLDSRIDKASERMP